MTVLTKRCCLTLAAALLATMTTFGAGAVAAEPEPIEGKYWWISPVGGTGTCVRPEDHFTNYGAEPKFTSLDWELGRDYYDDDVTGIDYKGRLCVKIKSKEELDAMAEPPSQPYFETRVTARMENSDRQSATTTVTFYNYYPTE